MSLIKLDNVSKFYKSDTNVSVGMQKINIEFNVGEFVAITGESGSGKSTMLNVLSGLDGYEEGEFFFNDEETSHFTIADWENYRGKYIGFIFQNYNIIDSYTVLQNVMLALEIQGYPKKDRKRRALELIERVGLTSHKHHKASKLSGGQKQRTVIARALAKDCLIIAADEPTGNLDSASGESIMQLLHEISKDKLVLLVTHDFDQAKTYATRRVVMHDGEIAEDKILKEVEISHEAKAMPTRKMNFWGIARFALRNLFSTPKKLFFLVIMQILITGIFTLIYTSEIRTIDRIGMSNNYDFLSTVPETRLLVQRRDGKDFSEQDLSYLAGQSHAKAVYRYGDNFYNEGINVRYQSQYVGYYIHVSYTDSSANLDVNDVEGSLPVREDEIVLPNTNSYHSDSLTIGSYVQISRGGSGSYYYENTDNEKTFKVVGFDRRDRETLYFSEAYLQKNHDLKYIHSDNYHRVESQLYNQYQQFDLKIADMKFEINDRDYSVTEFKKVYNQAEEHITSGEYTLVIDLKTLKIGDDIFPDMPNRTINNVVLKVVDVSVEGSQKTVSYSVNFGLRNFTEEAIKGYSSFYFVSPIKAVSIGVESMYQGKQFIKNIDSNVYRVLYPAAVMEKGSEFLVFIRTVLSVILLLLVGMFLYTIVHAVTKNVMNARKKDFAIFRSIGANKTLLARLIVVEQLILSVGSFILTALILRALLVNVQSLRAIIEYMQFKDYLVLLIAFAFFGVWSGNRFNRRIFNQSVIETISQSKED